MTLATTQPIGELDPDFSSPGAVALDWSAAREAVESAEVYWLSTVRPEARPHVTPLIAIWMDEALVFCTGRTERKRLNLESNSSCVITTGCNRLGEGVDIVVEGAASRVADDARLRRLADAYVEKYGPDWRYTVRERPASAGRSPPGPIFRGGVSGRRTWSPGPFRRPDITGESNHGPGRVSRAVRAGTYAWGEYREREALPGDDRQPRPDPDDLCFSRTKLWYRLAIG